MRTRRPARLLPRSRTVDADAGDSHSYAITNDPSGFFEIVGNEVRVAAVPAIDFETDQSHDITIETTDGAGNTYSEVVTISVNDLNEDPTDITLTGGSVDEGAAAGTTVATLSTVDVDAGDSHTYAITNDPSGFFEIVGNEVRVAAGAIIDFETDQTHDITIQTTDAGGNTYRKSSRSASTTWSTRPRPISPSPAARSMRTRRPARLSPRSPRSTPMPATATPTPSPTTRPASSRSSERGPRRGRRQPSTSRPISRTTSRSRPRMAPAIRTPRSSRSRSTTSTRIRPTSR